MSPSEPNDVVQTHSKQLQAELRAYEEGRRVERIRIAAYVESLEGTIANAHAIARMIAEGEHCK